MFGKKNFKELHGYLIAGLSVPENSFVQILLYSDVLKLNAVIPDVKPITKEFNLPLNKVKFIRLMSEREIKQVIEQSTPGMILGAAAFGVVGAMIGGRVKTKEKVVLKQILVIDYVSDGEKQIVLDCSKEPFTTQNAFMKYAKTLIPENIGNTPVQL